MSAFQIDVVSIFCRDHVKLADFYRTVMGFDEVAAVRSPIFIGLDGGGATLVKAPYDSYYDARQIVAADPEGNVFRITHQR